MALSYKTSLRNTRGDDITTAIGSNGKLRIYSGTPPADVNTALGSNTLLADLALSTTFAGATSGGVLTANAITNDSAADATGTATFFRLLTSGLTAIVQGTVGTSGADLNLNTTSIVANAAVSVTSFVITEGNP
jgi:hypothetical protein